MSAETLLTHYASGRLSPVEVLQAVTQRIAQHNPAAERVRRSQPRRAGGRRQSEARWRAGRPMGLLDGVPCTVKDLLDLAGFPTRRGSRLTSTAPAEDDAPPCSA